MADSLQARLAQEAAAQAQAANLVAFSGDATGNWPGEIFGQAGAELCKEFVDIAPSHNVGWTALGLVHNQTRQQIWSGYGVQVGQVVLKNSAVYLCTDYRLRCDRSPGLFPASVATGQGTIPPGQQINSGKIVESVFTYSERYHEFRMMDLSDVFMRYLRHQ